MSCAPGTQIPPAGTPAEVPAAICPALSPQMHPHLLYHPPCPARSLSTCPVVPQESGWVQGCQSHVTVGTKAGQRCGEGRSREERLPEQRLRAERAAHGRGSPSLLRGHRGTRQLRDPGRAVPGQDGPSHRRGEPAQPGRALGTELGDGHSSAPTALGEGSGRDIPKEPTGRKLSEAHLGEGGG